MSNTRIRYVSKPDGSKESLQVLVANNGAEFQVVISSDGKSGWVVTLPSREALIKVSATSEHKTKIKLKEALKSFGVIFLNEKRKVTRPEHITES